MLHMESKIFILSYLVIILNAADETDTSAFNCIYFKSKTFTQEDPNSSEHFKIKGLKNDMFVDFGKKTMTDGKNSYKIKQVPTGSGSGNERMS